MRAIAVFLDTGIIVAAKNKSDDKHTRAISLMERALKGEFGRVCTSDYILDEAITTALARTHRHDMAVNTGRFVIDSPRIDMLLVGRAEFLLAWERFRGMSKQPMSFTDCTSIVLMEAHNIERIMSFDSEFDSLAQRIH